MAQPRDMRLALLMVALAGCTTYDSPWQIRVGVVAQTITRDALRIAAEQRIVAGDVWLSIRSWGGADVAYPVVEDGDGLRVASAFDSAREDPHGALEISTRLSRDAEPAEQHPDVQYATLFIEATVARHHDQARVIEPRLTIELEVDVPRACDPPPIAVTGTVEGCLGAGGECGLVPLARRDGSYRAGPLALGMVVLWQQCSG
jgi:hypothetical protein